MILRIATAIALTCAITFTAQAQYRPPERAEKFRGRPVQPPPVQPAQPQSDATPAQPPFAYSPWTKFCGRDNNNPHPQKVCLTVKEARLQTGQFIAGAALIEQAGEEKKLLRITLPLGMQLMPGARMFIDGDVPRPAPYVTCLPAGCMADFDVNKDFIARLKQGQNLQLQGINAPGQLASYLLPLGDFAKAFDGPATDPRKFEEDQKRLQPR